MMNNNENQNENVVSMVAEENDAQESAAQSEAETRDQRMKNLIAAGSKFAKGTLRLAKPIRAGGEDVADLSYDFMKLSGRDYMDAMDSDTGTVNLFRVSARQGLALFARAAAKCTKGIDEYDIQERIGVEDAITATRLAAVFYNTSSRAGDKRITRG